MQWLRNVDRAVYRAEQFVAGILFLAMSFLMFASVTHRVFSRHEGRLSGVAIKALAGWGVTIEPTFGHDTLGPILNFAIAFFFIYLAERTRKREVANSKAKSFVLSFLVTASCALAIKGVLVAFPNGLVWGPVASLCCMLWVGFLGASLATYERGHLALEMGDKLWPKALAPHVKRLCLIVTASFCLFLFVLAAVSINDHHRSWAVNPLAGALMPTAIPKWVVFLIFPYTFAVMTLRFLGAVASPERDASDSHGIPASLVPGGEQETT
jgi:TRAP-type C4-dicarboxylate transport system permease small subunit